MLQRVFLIMIRGYQLLISPVLGCRCRFYPSCSEYAKQALETHGVVWAMMLIVRRLLKCHPWHPGGYDPLSTPNAPMNGKKT